MRLPRPSAPLVVSFLALFAALGGVSWAAIHLPPNSVGNAQLRPFSVGPRKILGGAVGARQVNSSQVQLRVTGPCTGGAVQSIAVSGNVTCTPVLPNEYGGTAQAVALGSGSTQVVSKSLPAGSSYLVIASANAHLTENMAGTQSVLVQCTLALTSNSQSNGPGTSNDLTVELGSSSSSMSSGTIPLALPVVTSSGLSTVGVSCSALGSPVNPAPTASVSATINAIQTASNS
jgi:hypothetical protein